MLSKEMHSVSPCLSGVHKVWLLLKIVRLAGLAGLAALLLRSDGGLLAAYVPALVAAAVLSKNRALTIAVWTAAVVVDSWSGAVGPRRHGGGRALGLDWVAGLHGYPADPSPVERQGREGGGVRRPGPGLCTARPCKLPKMSPVQHSEWTRTSAGRDDAAKGASSSASSGA